MKSFDEFFLLNTEDAKRYAVEVLGLFSPDEEICAEEIGDGNINYVFRVRARKSGRSVIIKQADKLLRSSGRSLDIGRSRIEARMLQIQGELAPEFVPALYNYDETMAAIAMEDVSEYKNLRTELAAGRVYPHLAEKLSDFLAGTLLPTTDLVMDRAEKKKRAAFFVNPELCDITEDLVLTEPYYNYKNRNIITKGNETFVEKELYLDIELHAEVAKLRCNFMNKAQALIHGDLHSGSIFANERGIKIIDPEFAFYGPIGYDIGNVIGNLFFALANKSFMEPDNTSVTEALESTIAELFDRTREKLNAKYDELVSFPLYRTDSFKEHYINGVMADSLGYAGTEIIRRVVGDSKVSELSSVTDPKLRLPMERALIRLGKELIMRRESLSQGSKIIELFGEI